MTRWLVIAVVAASACASRETPGAETTLVLGPHQVRVVVSVPAGWEALDQGALKRFRKGESEIVLQSLGKEDLESGALARLSPDDRREVKSTRTLLVGNHDAREIETWNRLDHTWPQRYVFVRADEDVIALHTPRLADPATLKAFESIRDSLHFVVSERR